MKKNKQTKETFSEDARKLGMDFLILGISFSKSIKSQLPPQ